MSARKPPSQSKPPTAETDAMDASEWEHGQHTPEVGADALTSLVKESATRTPPAGVPLAGGKTAARTVKRAGTKGGTSGTKRASTASGRTKRARTQTPVKPIEVTGAVNQNDIPTVPVPKFEPESPPAAPAPPAMDPPQTTIKRPGSTTLSPTAFIRSSGDTAPPLSTGVRTVTPPRAAGRPATTPPPLPLPRAAGAVALGNVLIEDVATAEPDDEAASGLAAYLSMPIGEERRARKATLPPPPPRMFPIEEEVAQSLPHVATARASSASTRNVAIAVGAAVVLIVVLVFALRGGDDEKKPVAQAAESPTPVEQVVPAPDAGSRSDREESVAEQVTGSSGGSADEVEIEIEVPESEGSAATTPVANAGSGSAATTPRTRSTFSALLKNKEVVLEYDGRIAKNSAPASEQAAISKARASHAAGTQRLNAGDYDSALDSYRQALSHYPGYIAAYRGMGLAYERKGDKINALKALRMYVSVVPNASDVGALRKRIDALAKR